MNHGKYIIINLFFIILFSFVFSYVLTEIRFKYTPSGIFNVGNKPKEIVKEIIYINNTEDEYIYKIIEEAKKSVVHIKVYKTLNEGIFTTEAIASGSGVIISKDGYIVTNYHVVSNGKKFIVTTYDNKEYEAKVIGTDPITDIAVLKINAKNLKPAKLGDSDKLKVGETVLAIGHPYELEFTVTKGIISGLNRTLKTYHNYKIRTAIQTDAAINPGNSGGPLINLKGEVIGINTAIYTTSGGFEGIGFAIPINLVKRVVSDIIKYGKVLRGWLGVTVVTSIDFFRYYDIKLDVKGALIMEVAKNSPAEKAGLRGTKIIDNRIFLGDIIVEINGKRILTADDLVDYILSTRPGEIVEIKYYRDGKYYKVRVKLAERPWP